MSKIASCRSCGWPLVSTFAFSKYEFYCLNCGALYGWLEPVPMEETTENLQWLEQVEEDWKRLGGFDLLSGGIMLKSCETCEKEYEPHISHATNSELDKHDTAQRRIKARAECSVEGCTHMDCLAAIGLELDYYADADD